MKTKYILTSGDKFVTVGKTSRPKTTDRREEAFEFKLNAAKNFLSSIPKTLSSFDWQIQPINETDLPIDPPAKADELEIELSETDTAEDLSPDDSLEKWIAELEETLKQLRQRNGQLSTELSQVSKEMTDINHKIELSRFNVVEGYRICKQLQNCLLRRRAIKDEQVKIQKILSSSFSDCASGNVSRFFENMKKRMYTPRVLTDLFDETQV